MAEEPDGVPDLASEIAAIRKMLASGQSTPVIPPAGVTTGIDARVLEAVVREKVALFLTADQIEARIQVGIRDRLGAIGLRIDDEHIEETGEAIRSALKWHKRIDKVIAGMVISVLAAIGYALLGLVGIKLPSAGGN